MRLLLDEDEYGPGTLRRIRTAVNNYLDSMPADEAEALVDTISAVLIPVIAICCASCVARHCYRSINTSIY